MKTTYIALMDQVYKCTETHDGRGVTIELKELGIVVTGLTSLDADSKIKEAVSAVIRPIGKSVHQLRVERFMRRISALRGGSFPVRDRPTEQIGADERLLRAKLMMEEMIELIRDGLGVDISLWEDNLDDEIASVSDLTFTIRRPASLVDTVDGCCDVNVTVTGTLSAFGIKDLGPQQLVDASNLMKFEKGCKLREDGKFMKPENWEPPALEAEIEKQRVKDTGVVDLTVSKPPISGVK